MHPSILDPKHLIEELTYIQNEVTAKLIFTSNIKNIFLWEKSIVVKAYITNETLNFILEIPQIDNHIGNLCNSFNLIKSV